MPSSRSLSTLIRATDSRVVVEHLKVADRFLSRLVGLQFQKPLANNAGLLITPCSSLHTACMRFGIDVIMLDSGDEVIGIKRQLRPWRLMLCTRGTASVVEMTAGAVPPWLKIGDQLCAISKNT